jgi:phosphoglycerate dehydrogenase-like enzyme
MPEPTRILLWTDAPGPYLDAIAAAQLTGRVAVEALARKDTPTQAQRADTEAMLAWGVPPGLLPHMPKLRWAQALTAGVEGWLALPDLPPALTLTCARGTHRESMAENIMGALFHLTKPYPAIVEDQKHSKWTRRLATPLAGQTLGILGLGVIGQQVAQIAATIGMRVIGTKRRAAALTGVAEVMPPEQTDQVLGQSDFVLLLLPATPETENFMNARRLARMKPGAWVLNFGRGHLIADADLIAAVQAKRIAGAILDVFRQEPLPVEHPFWTTAGIVVLPHIGGGHPQRDTVVARLFADNLARFLDDRPLREVVDRAVGY